MRTVPLGRTGLRISRVGLGCGNVGGVGSAPAFFGMGESAEEALRLMDRAVEMGINFFDTADAYGGGRSEEAIGRWLRRSGSSGRSRVLLSSKVFHPTGDDPADRGLSRPRILRQIEGSLRRLGTDHLDLYLIHEPDPDTPLEETLHALDELVRAGKVRHFGASNVDAAWLVESLALGRKHGLRRFEWVQNSYSLLDRTPEAGLFPLCARERIGFTPFSPLAGGWLAGKYRRGEPFPVGSRMTMRPEAYEGFVNAPTFAALDALRAAAARRGVSMAGLALAWVLGHPVVTAAIVGPRRPEHFGPVREAVEMELSEEDRAELTALFEGSRT